MNSAAQCLCPTAASAAGDGGGCIAAGSARGGLGIQIISTPQGVMSDSDARAKNVGGEVLCRVF